MQHLDKKNETKKDLPTDAFKKKKKNEGKSDQTRVFTFYVMAFSTVNIITLRQI